MVSGSEIIVVALAGVGLVLLLGSSLAGILTRLRRGVVRDPAPERTTFRAAWRRVSAAVARRPKR